jgi:hypothetical protein
LFRPTGILVGRDKLSGNGADGCELLNDQLVIDKELIVVVLRVNFCSLDFYDNEKQVEFTVQLKIIGKIQLSK